jgi:hypothetical protein
MEAKVTIDGLDVIDVVKYITKKRNKFIAMMLAELEESMEPESNEYKFVRKIILDGMNDYTRSTMRTLFGDVEGLIMK